MMEQRRGRSVPVSDGRRLVNELMRQSRRVPLVTLRRECSIAALVEARSNGASRLSWVAIFAKAYGLVAERNVHLRRNWLSFPWGRIYEHPVSECAVLIEREWQGEETVLAAKIRAPETMPLEALDGHLKRFRTEPVRSVSSFRQLLRIARYPALLRRFIFWSTLNWSGYKRCRRFGTFLISSLGNFGCEILVPQMPLTAYLAFGPISPDGNVAITLAFDHRVMDGRQAARALQDLEETLNTTLARELRSLGTAEPNRMPESTLVPCPN